MKPLFSSIIFFLFTFSSVFGQFTPNTLGILPNTVSETSGLLYYNNKLITHNDSGNLAQLYEIDTLSLTITRTVTISNALNVDWEDIAQDDLYIYIGDIGNNSGTRKKLTVYKISKDDYNRLDTVTADIINYKYEDQLDFSDIGNSDWDAEAMFVFESQLVVLTKEWQSGGTVAYSIPITPGNYTAKKLDSYPIGGLVTGASYNPGTGVLLIIGYTGLLSPFLYQINGLKKDSIFNEEISDLGITMGNAQVEGITYASNNKYFISSELFKRETFLIKYDASLFSFLLFEENITEIKDEEDENQESEKKLLIYSKSGDNQLFYVLPDNVVVYGRAIYDVSGKRVSFNNASLLEQNFIDTSGLKSAIYYLTVYGRNGIFSKPFIKN